MEDVGKEGEVGVKWHGVECPQEERGGASCVELNFALQKFYHGVHAGPPMVHHPSFRIITDRAKLGLNLCATSL